MKPRGEAMFRRPIITLQTFNRMSLVGFLLSFAGIMGSIVIANMPLFAVIERPALWVLLVIAIAGALILAASRMSRVVE
jgi:uncharacterized membrane protein YfcA